MPPRLLLLDAPDVDSDVTVNWRRARAIRQAADVLVAVLTQQKYNDAAVKQFFRAAVEADKPIVVVFNQCELAADARVLAALAGDVLRRDRRPAGIGLRGPLRSPGGRGVCGCRFLCAFAIELPSSRWESADRFAAAPISATIWRRCTSTPSRSARSAGRCAACSIRGTACRPISIRSAAAAGEFSAAAAALSATEMARVGWPTLPTGVLVDEIRHWWDASRQPWSRQIHGFYRAVGRGVTWPVRAAWGSLAGPPARSRRAVPQQERAAIVAAVEKLLDELDRLAQVGNDTLRPRLRQLLGGHARATLLDRVQAAHDSLAGRRRALSGVPAGGARRLAAARIRGPSGSCNRSTTPRRWPGRPSPWRLFFTGLHFAGDLVGQAAAHAAGATAGPLATEAAIAGGITGGGEALVSGTSEGVRQAAGRLFGRLQVPLCPAAGRAGWPSGSNASCWAICWPTSAAARKCRKGRRIKKL